MLDLGISISSTAMSRRTFLLGAAGLPALALTGLGSAGVTQGFTALPSVTGYTATAGRFRRAPAGFVRCAANEERLCYNSDGTFRGQYLQGADTYFSAPWDDSSATHGSGDPAFLTGDSGDRIRYAGEHTESDIFGGTGGGVVIRSEAQNQIHTASNIPATAVVAGDTIRYHMIVSISGATSAGIVQIRGSNPGFGLDFPHDASGNITAPENWGIYRTGAHDMGVINGKRWWYLWVDRRATGTANASIGFGTGNIPAQSGKSYHICEMMVQKNPATAPAAVPVCAESKTFAADTLTTDLTGTGYVCAGLAMARSQMTNGAIAAPSVNIGVPYEPLETRIALSPSAETADRTGIMPNVNQHQYFSPWLNPANLNLFYGPGFFSSGWINARLAGFNAVNVTVRSVFQATDRLRAVLGNASTSQTVITGALDIDGVVFHPSGDKRTVMFEQASIPDINGTYYLAAGAGVAVTNCLVMGAPVALSRAAYSAQADETDALRVYIGELYLLTRTGGTISVAGTRTHNLARTQIQSDQRTSTFTLNTNDFCATQFWMDALYIGRGTLTSWTGDRMFTAYTTAQQEMGIYQSERPVRVSFDSGATWADLASTSLTKETLPHGLLGEYIGTYNFDTDTFTSGTDSAKTMRVRYWDFGSLAFDVFDKFGFQYYASQMDRGDHTRFPDDGDVFRLKSGDLWIDVTYQNGKWTDSSTYVRSTTGNPAAGIAGISNDHVQINRTDVIMTASNLSRNCFFMGPKGGYFLTGSPSGAAQSNLDNFTVENFLMICEGTNGLRWDHAGVANAECLVKDAVFIEARQKFNFADGSAQVLSIGAAGAGNILNLDNVTILNSGTSGAAVLLQDGATAPALATEVTRIPGRARRNYNEYDPLPEGSKFPLYLPAANYSIAQGTAIFPAYEDIWDFRMTAFAQTDSGVPLNAIIAAAQGTHQRWEPVISAIKAKYHVPPELTATIVNSAAVGTVAGAVSSTALVTSEGDAALGFFEIVGGNLRTARALTGVDQVFVLRGNAGETFVVDVRT